MLSQAALGMLVGQDQTFVSKYENGVRRLDFLETLDICRVLEIDIHTLIEELEYGNRSIP
jgi:transcriptional regulator with XRE-family HTH domain